ncbi:cross-pathway control WD-repeat protein cpc2 [Mucor velutinosus]|uniref:Cross-pathway control WD-repeat protein cpc2 n=1 Tax=Mucor velutinosus TaxID=708070 RepID=A0AAN7HNH1_9FUNG|nr:cross-pathway control WD-repeat protein cpc2 [Mucor velutinosus]
MESVKPKRFSFAGFSNSLSRSLSFGGGQAHAKQTATTTADNTTSPPSQPDTKASRRAQKSKSLYIKSFKKVGASEPHIRTSYDASEAVQSNGKEVRNSIRRSLSAVLYASPHGGEGDNKLVPILVTPGLSESVGGVMISDKPAPTEEKPAAKKKSTEYDNTLEVFESKKKEENDNSATILWQGYGYMLADKGESTLDELEQRFESEVWASYRGLIHPLHLIVVDDDESKWNNLTVKELRQYYDNYGSMMLKIREARMLKQQKQYIEQNQMSNIL